MKLILCSVCSFVLGALLLTAETAATKSTARQPLVTSGETREADKEAIREHIDKIE